jgi:hypothetical protein
MTLTVRKSILSASILLALAGFSVSSQAQDAASDSTVRYTAEYFQEWA